MARFYSEAHTESGEQIDIPTPAVDMGSSQTRFGSSGLFVSGGAYVRKSVFGSRELSVSWNNLDTYDTAALLRLSEAGPFVWDNPMAHANVAPPWLANHGALSEVEHDKLGFSRSTYFLDRDGVEFAGFDTVSNKYKGYPLVDGVTSGVTYMLSSASDAPLFKFVIPEGFKAVIWCVGSRESTGSIRVRRDSGGSLYAVPLNSPTSSGGYPTSSVTVSSTGLFRAYLYGSGDFWLSSLNVRIVPEDMGVDTLMYVPGLGNSELGFTEEGLTLVQHSAALDMQSAAATWKETGWWR